MAFKDLPNEGIMGSAVSAAGSAEFSPKNLEDDLAHVFICQMPPVFSDFFLPVVLESRKEVLHRILNQRKGQIKWVTYKGT